MNRRVNIPVRVIQPDDYRRVASGRWPRPVKPVVEPAQDVAPVAPEPSAMAEEWRRKAARLQAQVEALEGEAAQLQADLEEQRGQVERAQSEAEEWREQALRLQADMDNYRKRQRRLAQDEIVSERKRLLADFVQVVDDLERALAATDTGDEALQRGVKLTHQAALQMLKKEGVERIEAENQAFDPNWHEAVSTVASSSPGTDSGTVVQVLQPGYRLGEALLRPAKVVVAV